MTRREVIAAVESVAGAALACSLVPLYRLELESHGDHCIRGFPSFGVFSIAVIAAIASYLLLRVPRFRLTLAATVGLICGLAFLVARVAVDFGPCMN